MRVQTSSATMRSMIRVALVVALILSLLAVAACGRPYKPEGDEAERVVNTLKFVRHQNGMCIGVTSFYTYGGYTGTSLVVAPTEACK